LKVEWFGVRGKLLQWIKHLLIGQRQRVSIGSSLSTWSEVNSGVPQDVVLGPLLFILYINDCLKNISCKAVIVPDDIKLWTAI